MDTTSHALASNSTSVYTPSHTPRPHGTAPPPAVLAAFNVTASVHPLPGGQSTSYLAGDFVLKPAEDPPLDAITLPLLAALPPSDAYRVPRPVEADTTNTSAHEAGDGDSNKAGSECRFIFQGWTCTEYLPHTRTLDPATFPMTLPLYNQIITASRAFHAALTGLVTEEPELLRTSSTRWAVAARVAFEEIQYTPRWPQVGVLMERLWKLLRIVESAGRRGGRRGGESMDGENGNEDGMRVQLVHGDLSGNVLFSDGVGNQDSKQPPPAIIDFSPYWRPRLYAEAVMAGDGLLWYGAGEDVFMEASITLPKLEMLIRAVLFRAVSEPWERAQDLVMEVEYFDRVLRMLEGRVDGMTQNLEFV